MLAPRTFGSVGHKQTCRNQEKQGMGTGERADVTFMDVQIFVMWALQNERINTGTELHTGCVV